MDFQERLQNREKPILTFVMSVRPHGTTLLPLDAHSLNFIFQEFYVSVSVGHKSIMYNKPTRCNSGSIVFINNYKYALHVSDALCVYHQEHYKL